MAWPSLLIDSAFGCFNSPRWSNAPSSKKNRILSPELSK